MSDSQLLAQGSRAIEIINAVLVLTLGIAASLVVVAGHCRRWQHRIRQKKSAAG
jgi:hypothetical protein